MESEEYKAIWLLRIIAVHFKYQLLSSNHQLIISCKKTKCPIRKHKVFVVIDKVLMVKVLYFSDSMPIPLNSLD